MKQLVLSAVIFLSISVSATISQVQSAANWSCSGTSCAQPFTLKPTTHNLIAVWTFWQTTGTFTASVSDSLGNGTGTPPVFPSAVGPTLQASASTPTAAQVFYAKNIQNPAGSPDTVTVTFSGTGTISAAGVVIVEYSGLDQNYPLDSISAGYSTALDQTNLLDSGTVAPANSNLLVFGGGIIDGGSGSIIAGTGFTSVASSAIGSASAITEQNASTITGNNALRRATACLGSLTTCSTSTGNWLMQMAIFRAGGPPIQRRQF